MRRRVSGSVVLPLGKLMAMHGLRGIVHSADDAHFDLEDHVQGDVTRHFEDGFEFRTGPPPPPTTLSDPVQATTTRLGVRVEVCVVERDAHTSEVFYQIHNAPDDSSSVEHELCARVRRMAVRLGRD